MKHSINTICLLAVLSLAGSTAFAQIHRMERTDSARAERAHDLNPVVVTGTGHHQRLQATATPVRTLSSREMQEQGIATFEDAITRMVPQVSMAPSSMGSFLRMNGLGNKYLLILINGQKLSGDISGNVDLARINMSRVKRIEVLDGAASSLYGSDAIGGVINIITDQPTRQLIGVTSDTRVSGEGKLTENVNLDVFTHGFGSYTSYTHDRADSYQNNDLVYVKGSDTETQQTLAPLFTGYRSHLLSQRFTFAPLKQLALNAGIDYNDKITDRPDTREDITGGTSYEMHYRALRWYAGGIYKFTPKNSLQVDFTSDHFRYGKEYDVATKTQAVGDYVQSKRQHTMEGQAKAILGLLADGTTIFGADWRRDHLEATSGSIDEAANIFALYGQHEQRLWGHLTATAGLRYDYHENFGSHLTPKVALLGSFGHFNLRANYSAGFRAPGLDELHYHYFAVNRGKPQIIFGNDRLDPEKSHYVSVGAEYRTARFAVGVTGFVNRVRDMVVRQNIDVDAASLARLQTEFPEMTADQAALLERYSLYKNSDRGDIKGLQVNVSANLFNGFNLTANYALTHARSYSDGVWRNLERSIKNVGTLAANYYHSWGLYTLNVNLNGRLQSKTYYPDYEDAPGYGVWNISTHHTFDAVRWAVIEPSVGVDNLFDRVDRRIDSSNRRYALYSPGRMLVVGLKLKFKH
ncbi:MAG: TonB-dependent receptor [Bacteroidales bacterium]|nr:TonB-dependent receptor [Bacteroidales bacterium]